MTGLLVTADLMFASRVQGMAKQRGAQIHVSRWDQALEAVAESSFPLVMVDLSRDGLDQLPELLARVQAAGAGTHVVAYGPHVDETTLAAARQAGCHEVLTRGQFHQQIGDLLNARLGSSPAD